MVSGLLWASPLPPVRSGVSDYSAELLEELGSRCEVRVVIPPEGGDMARWAEGRGLATVGAEVEPGDDERLIVHLGNNPYHRWLIPLARRHAVVVLHDLVLHHLLVETTVAEGDLDGYRTALNASHPAQAAALARARGKGLSGPLDPFLFPALPWFLRGARQVVVHSRWGAGEVARACPDLPVAELPMPALDPFPLDRMDLRQSLGLASEDLVVMHLGFLTREKGLEIVLQAVAAAVRCGAPIRLLTVGEGAMAAEVARLAEALGVGDRVSTTGWVEAEDFPRLPAAADLGVVLRTRSAGETSAAVVRFLAGATPVAVIGRRQFLEWPAEAALRVTPGPSAVADLTRTLLGVAEEHRSGAWSARRSAARAAYAAGHTPALVADRLLEIL